MVTVRVEKTSKGWIRKNGYISLLARSEDEDLTIVSNVVA